MDYLATIFGIYYNGILLRLLKEELALKDNEYFDIILD
jgi:hypothetical protein